MFVCFGDFFCCFLFWFVFALGFWFALVVLVLPAFFGFCCGLCLALCFVGFGLWFALAVCCCYLLCFLW